MWTNRGILKAVLLVLVLFCNLVSASPWQQGQAIFQQKCVLCHGWQGKGDGKLARLIKGAPPANFTLSTLTMQAMEDMVRRGGAANGRSDSMPPWQSELTDEQISAVTLYIYSLRKESE